MKKTSMKKGILLACLFLVMITGLAKAETKIVNVYPSTYSPGADDDNPIRHTYSVQGMLPTVEMSDNSISIGFLKAGSSLNVSLYDSEGNLLYNNVCLVSSDMVTFVLPSGISEATIKVSIVINGITYVGKVCS